MALSAQDAATRRDVAEILSLSVGSRLFPDYLELIPQLNEVYELELAFYESRVLTPEEIIRNGAYFARVGNTLTRHFLMCRGEPVRLPQYSSARLKSFFASNQFKTGYATHGLFPYRGKFHPQMVKGLLNAMGLKPGDTVLDPMMGSGTVLIEARLMGIKWVGVDASPFCRFMTQVKLDALTLPLPPLRTALKQSRTVFEYFRKVAGTPESGSKARNHEVQLQWFSGEADIPDSAPSRSGEGLPEGCELPEVHDLLLLAYLDSAGYAERSNRKSPEEGLLPRNMSYTG